MRTDPGPARIVALACAVMVATAAPASAQRPTRGEDESAALVAEGREALRRGKLDAAAAALDQAIALNPRRVEAYVLRSGVHAARKQYRAGVELMRRAQVLAPNDEEVLTALGSQLMLAGEAAAGAPILAQVVARNPRRYDAQLLLGHHGHASGRWADAIAALEAYFAARPAALASEDARHRIELADAYLRARRPADALPLFQRAASELRGDLRARLGVAWATAALDCRRARPLLRDLAPAAEAHPEVWLVDGRCALALGDPAAALALGRRYAERAPAAAGGHALVGEAHAARGNLDAARRSLAEARRLEPARRRWTVRYASVLRRAGDAAGALAVLDPLGAPARPADDPDWWLELGEALLATGDAAGAASRLTPIAADLPAGAAVRAVLGAAQLATGRADLAIATLEPAAASSPRARKLLGDALAAAAAARLAAGDATAAEPLLARAETIDPSPAVWRNLGIARLALDRPLDAMLVLDRAVKADPALTSAGAPLTAMLAARARALSGDTAAARPLYDRALTAATGDAALEVALDWAASELGPGGDPALAVAALERAAPAARATSTSPGGATNAKSAGALGADPGGATNANPAGAGPAPAPAGGTPAAALVARYQAGLGDARHAAGLAALRAGQGARAVELLRGAVAVSPTPARRCDLALATVTAGDPTASLAALRAVAGQPCPFPPPADTQAAPILIAFTEGLAARRAVRSLERLTSLGGAPTGPAASLRHTAIRVVALEAAREAYAAGALADVRRFVQAARNAPARAGADEVALASAALELAEGRLAPAIAALERLAPRLPEALVHLGIAYERAGAPDKALDAFRRARRASARGAPLAEWIEALERIYGGAP